MIIRLQLQPVSPPPPMSSCPTPPPLPTAALHSSSLASHPASSPDLVKARADNRRAVDEMVIAVYQGRISPGKLNGLRQKYALQTAEATACIETAFLAAHAPR